MTIAAELVKELKDRTGAGMMDCKKALQESNGDIEAAVDWLRKKGIASAAKKADRVAADGLVGVITEDKVGAIVEINSETDFVAKTEKFQNLVSLIAREAIKFKDIDSLKSSKLSNGKSVAEEVTENIATIGENLNLRRMQRLVVENGVVRSYVHNSVAPNLGKLGVIVAIEGMGDVEKLSTLAKKLAMHIAAAKPKALNVEDLSKDAIEREKAVFAEQSRASGKPEDIIAKMVEGRMRKFYEEAVLMHQFFIMDDKLTIKDLIDQATKELGSEVKIKGFVKFELGEGVEQVKTDFAAEVAAITSK